MRIQSSAPVVALLAVTALACGTTDPGPSWPRATATSETAALTSAPVAPRPENAAPELEQPDLAIEAPATEPAASSTPSEVCAPADLMCAMRKQQRGQRSSPPSPGGHLFDRGAASSALTSAATRAKQCSPAGATTTSFKVRVDFAPSGKVTAVAVAPEGTHLGDCVAGAFRNALIPPFDGGPMTVSKSVSIP